MTTQDVDSTTQTMKVFNLSNAHGLTVGVINFGGRIVSLKAPDRNGKSEDVLLGYDTPQQYLDGSPYFGAIIGRFANRIAKAKFSLQGKEYALTMNNGKHTLHGGPGGFHNVYWKENTGSSDKHSLQLEYESKDGEEGYPGNLFTTIRYTLTNSNELILDYTATTDKETVVNLTSHGYFNLSGAGNGDVLDHEIMINAEYFTPVDEGLIPKGSITSVDGTPFDFRTARKMGAQIDGSDDQLRYGKGYDHNWVLNKNDNLLSLAARVIETKSGRILEVLTTEPGLQFYSGNFLDGTDVGKGGKPYYFRTAFCLEAQHFPDSPNRPDFPSVVLRPGEVYTQRTIYKFSVMPAG